MQGGRFFTEATSLKNANRTESKFYIMAKDDTSVIDSYLRFTIAKPLFYIYTPCTNVRTGRIGEFISNWK